MSERTPFPTVLDSTIVGTFKRCQRKGYLEYFEHWKPKSLSVHLHAGAAFAKGLEVAREAFFVEHRTVEDSTALGMGALLRAYGDFECPEDSAKSANRMAGALEYYFNAWPLGADGATPVEFPGGRHGIEFSFAEPLPIMHPETGEPLVYVGRMDQVVNFAGGVFVEDDKTASSLGASWPKQWDLRSQFTGYAWGCQQAGLKTDGVLVRGVSILKTKYDHMEAVSYRPQWQIDRWYSETMDFIEGMVEAWKKGKYRHDLDHACTDFGGCPLRMVCMSQDESVWLEQYFEKRVWDPVNRLETKV